MSSSVRSRLAVVLGWIVGGVFAAAAVPKIMQPGEFAVAIYRYQLLPHAAINGLAVFLPWLEITCAAALFVLPRWRRGALLLVILMLLVFTTALGLNLYRGLDIACGCFSVKAAQGHVGWLSLARNAALLLAAGWALRATAAAPTPAR